MKKLNNQGFGAIEMVLCLVIVGILGFTGWYVYQSNNKANDTLQTAQKASKSTPAVVKVDKEAIAKIAILGQTSEAAKDSGIAVNVELKNNDTVKHNVTVKVTFTNAAKQTLESDTATLKDLAAGETKTLTVTGTSKVASFSDIKVTVTRVN